MTGLELVLLLLAVAAGLRLVATRIHVPYPTLLVIGGLLLALVPGLPRIAFSPDVLFLVFVPPLLYGGAREISFRDFRDAIGPIVRLAVFMVLVSMVAVAVTAHWLDHDFTWPAAFALGAIISPPDPVAVLSILRTLGAPRFISNTLEGEGLLNDATALVCYRIAVAAAVTGVFSACQAFVQFAVAAAGGVVVGLVISIAVRSIRTRIGDQSVVQNTIALLTPFAVYLPAEFVHASGIVAVVTAALYASRQARFVSPETRLQSDATWKMVSFLLESLIFILVGLELPYVVRALQSHNVEHVVGEAVVVTLCAVVVRLLWVFPSAYVLGYVSRRVFGTREQAPPWRYPLFIGWAGMRGGDSLVIALALPLVTRMGTPFPARDQIVFITFVVIFATLVVQGMTLRPVMRWLRIQADGSTEDEEAHARLVVAEAGLEALDKAMQQGLRHPEVARYLRQRHAQRARRWAAQEARRLHGREHTGGDHTISAPAHEGGELDAERTLEYRRLRFEMIEAQRTALVSLRDREVIGDDVLRTVERDLDLESMLLASRDPVVEPPSEVTPD